MVCLVCVLLCGVPLHDGFVSLRESGVMLCAYSRGASK